MPNNTYVITEIAGVSATSISDTVHNAISRANQTLKALEWVARPQYNRRRRSPEAKKETLMRLELRGQRIKLTDALRTHVERRLQYALGQFGPYLLQGTVLLANLNGPYGGSDKQCRIAVALQQSGHLHVEEVDVDLYTAIDRAAERIGLVVARDLERWGELSVRIPTAIRIPAAAVFHRRPCADG